MKYIKYCSPKGLKENKMLLDNAKRTISKDDYKKVKRSFLSNNLAFSLQIFIMGIILILLVGVLSFNLYASIVCAFFPTKVEFINTTFYFLSLMTITLLIYQRYRQFKATKYLFLIQLIEIFQSINTSTPQINKNIFLFKEQNSLQVRGVFKDTSSC